MEELIKQLENIDELIGLTITELEELAKKLDEKIEESKAWDQPLSEKLRKKLHRELWRLKLFIESGIFLREESRVFKELGKTEDYLKMRYYYYDTTLLTVYIPPIYEELKEEIKNFQDRTITPLFIYQKGFTEHFHLLEYLKAYQTYEEAYKLLDLIKEKEFNKLKLLKYKDFKLLLVSNMVDTLLRHLFKHGRDKEIEERISYHLQEVEKLEKNRLFNALNRIEFYIATDEMQKAGELLKELDDEILSTPRKNAELVPILYREWGLYSWKRRDTEGAARYLKRALKEALFTMDELRAKEIIDTILLIMAIDTPYINITTPEGQELLIYLLETLLAKDSYFTENHSRKVADFSVKVARYYGELIGRPFNRKELTRIYFAGLLYDIGKLYIPWYVLNKPTKPIDLEWETIRFHPVYSGIIMKKIGFPQFARYVEEHHERIDGSGYPYGIKNPHIVAQIIGIVDEFTSAISPKRIKGTRKLSPKQALEEIKSYGKQKFNPMVVKAFESFVRSYFPD